MTLWRKHLALEHFNNVRNGTKTIEGRLNTGDASRMKRGDLVVWFNEQEEQRVLITAIRPHATFEALLRAEGLAQCLPGVASVEAGIEVYRQWYSAAKEAEHGVLAIVMARH